MSLPNYPSPSPFHSARASIDLSMQSDDRRMSVRVRGKPGGNLPCSSCFASLAEASAFFEPGSVGYSVTRDAGQLDGIELRTHGWSVEPLQVEEVHSSYFSDDARFPKGCVEFDCALARRINGERAVEEPERRVGVLTPGPG